MRCYVVCCVLLSFACCCVYNCLVRFHQFLQYFGYSQRAMSELNIGTFCKMMSDFALEYRTTRDRVIHQRQKKADQRQRNMTRGKMIVEVSAAALVAYISGMLLCVTLQLVMTDLSQLFTLVILPRRATVTRALSNTGFFCLLFLQMTPLNCFALCNVYRILFYLMT